MKVEDQIIMNIEQQVVRYEDDLERRKQQQIEQEAWRQYFIVWGRNHAPATRQLMQQTAQMINWRIDDEESTMMEVMREVDEAAAYTDASPKNGDGVSDYFPDRIKGW